MRQNFGGKYMSQCNIGLNKIELGGFSMVMVIIFCFMAEKRTSCKENYTF